MSDYGHPKDPYQPTNQPIPPHMQQHNVVGGSPLAPKPPYFPPRKSHKLRTVGIVVGSLFGLLIVAAVLTPGQPAKEAATPPAAVSTVDNGPTPDPVVTPTNKPSPPPAPKVVAPTVKDFKLTVKTLTKHCFGSAGCNVTFRILVAYSGPSLDPSKTYEVLYTVKGGEGPLENKLTVTGDTVEFDEEEMVSTSKSTVKLTAVVTDVMEA